MAKTTVTFGEIMLRLAPPGFERFLVDAHAVALKPGAGIAFAGGVVSPDPRIISRGIAHNHTVPVLPLGVRIGLREATVGIARQGARMSGAKKGQRS